MKYYTGVGSRQTPDDVLDYMRHAAATLCGAGYRLRSGHAAGADRAFELGANGLADVYLPWTGFGCKPYKDDPGMPVLGDPIVLQHADYVRFYEYLVRQGIRKATPYDSHKSLHGRNLCQVLGSDPLTAPVLSDFLVCWCPVDDAGEPTGGTRTAVLVARLYGIPSYNLNVSTEKSAFDTFLVSV